MGKVSQSAMKKVMEALGQASEPKLHAELRVLGKSWPQLTEALRLLVRAVEEKPVEDEHLRMLSREIQKASGATRAALERRLAVAQDMGYGGLMWFGQTGVSDRVLDGVFDQWYLKGPRMSRQVHRIRRAWPDLAKALDGLCNERLK